MKSKLFVLICECGAHLMVGEHELMFLSKDRQSDTSPIRVECQFCGRQHDFTMTISYESVYTPGKLPEKKDIYTFSEIRDAAKELGVKLLKEQNDLHGWCSYDDMCCKVWDYLQQNTNLKNMLGRRVQQLFRDISAEYFRRYEEKQQ